MFEFVQSNSSQFIRQEHKKTREYWCWFEAKQILEGVKLSTKELQFKKEAGEFLAHLLSHLFEKSPLKYAIIPNAGCLNPLYLGYLVKRNYCQNHMGIIFQKLVSIGRISVKSAELLKEGILSSLILLIKAWNHFLPFIHCKIELIPFFGQLWDLPSFAQTFGTLWKCLWSCIMVNLH